VIDEAADGVLQGRGGHWLRSAVEPGKQARLFKVGALKGLYDGEGFGQCGTLGGLFMVGIWIDQNK